MRRGCFLQFAKAPRAGRVKTRLQPALTALQAAALARVLTAHVAAALDAIPPGWDAFICADEPGDPFLCELAARHKRVIREQGAGDLGPRMQRALALALRDYPAAILVGSDCPGFDPDYLLEATRILARADAVLGPAQDGGYVLIGFSRMREAVFDGPAWGSDSVLATQRARLQALGHSWEELPLRADIDRPEDLRQLGEDSPLRRW
ncbi:MAG: TIGR04282 family arsenosugar biosynthesis glycosyltransferase [Pseudomonadales bacterium]|nr:TIGR04282 family arsenosugar biosynthesis glycosyltransferase [Pseudomonadales bacterium]